MQRVKDSMAKLEAGGDAWLATSAPLDAQPGLYGGAWLWGRMLLIEGIYHFNSQP